MDPERGALPPPQDGQQVHTRDSRGQTEALDRLVNLFEGVVALEADQDRPARPQEATATLAHPPVHLADVEPRPLPALAVHLRVQVPVPPRRIAADAVVAEPIVDEGEETGGGKAQRRGGVAPQTAR